MQITFLAHSGFLAEFSTLNILFDWWKGDLPPLGEKPLLVCVSHRHEDHFSPRIFSLDDGSRPVRFLLGKDIRLTDRNCQRWGISRETAETCQRVSGEETISPFSAVTVETLRSTDAGVAFLVQAEGRTVFHAGDLNWWHWAEESKAWNRNMEANFKRYTEPLRGRSIDLAMMPLDSRLGEAEDWGLSYLMELAQVGRVLPMHQWEDFSPTERFCRNHPQWADRILPVSASGQVFSLP